MKREEHFRKYRNTGKMAEVHKKFVKERSQNYSLLSGKSSSKNHQSQFGK